ncbi:hypothetical protein D2Q93_00620 [Alicyclobacillaceae bacterium I2511]|nr:hypothetical protein D2Q93_00620 [Alicyclobacillaceae bacterium I2511]
MNSGRDTARRFLQIRQSLEFLAQQALVDALENQAQCDQMVVEKSGIRMDLLNHQEKLSSGELWQQWYATLQVAELSVQSAQLNAQVQASQVTLRRQEVLTAHQEKRRWEVTVQRLEEQTRQAQMHLEQHNADEMAGIRHGWINPL